MFDAACIITCSTKAGCMRILKFLIYFHLFPHMLLNALGRLKALIKKDARFRKYLLLAFRPCTGNSANEQVVCK